MPDVNIASGEGGGGKYVIFTGYCLYVPRGLARVVDTYHLRVSISCCFRVAGSSNITLTTDPSSMGWGATTHQSQTQSLWSRAEGEFHINILELLSVNLWFVSLLLSVSNQHIRIMSDISTKFSYFNAMGGCRKKGCNAFTKEICLRAMKGPNWLSAAHQPGRLTTTAIVFFGIYFWYLSLFDLIMTLAKRVNVVYHILMDTLQTKLNCLTLQDL